MPTTSYDVFAFRALLLEVVCGRRPVDVYPILSLNCCFCRELELLLYLYVLNLSCCFYLEVELLLYLQVVCLVRLAYLQHFCWLF
jgi:hypothetical protein